MNPSTIAVVICATKSYGYALIAQLRRVQAAIVQCPSIKSGVVILVGDNCAEMKAAELQYKESLPAGFSVYRIEGTFQDGLQNYSNPAQLVIARMRSAGFTEARKRNVDICWSLDSDVLPQSNTLSCLIQGLQFADGIYGVSTCPYPSQGGGDFLGGRGTTQRPILLDVYDDERVLSLQLEERIQKHRDRFQLLKEKHLTDAAFLAEDKAIGEAVKVSPSKGDVFFLNSGTGVIPFVALLKERLAASVAEKIKSLLPKKSPLAAKLAKSVNAHVAEIIGKQADKFKPRGFRRRGWLSASYPAIGWGAILPVDWCGFGCTLMNRYALSLAQFDGYDGSGTEDLYICWKRWHRNNVKINCITHAPCDHVIRDTSKKGNYILLQAYHETHDTECFGHLRIERRSWFQQTEGERAPNAKRNKPAKLTAKRRRKK